MAELVFLGGLGGALAALFTWAFRVLPREEWQVLAALPAVQESPGVWRGINLTYYGFFTATACAAAAALLLVLLGSLGVPAWATLVLVAATLVLCLPAANLIARRVERNAGALSVAGAFIVGFVAVPALVPVVNLSLGKAFGFQMPWLPTLAAVAVAYALGEGIGRLACISFGCCYGKPLAECRPLVRRLFAKRFFAFSGRTKKATYQGGLEGVPLVPIQAVTAVFHVLAALIGTCLFLRGHGGAALLATVALTQVWRLLSEFYRADDRGPGKLSAYQVMAILAVPATVALVALVEQAPSPEGDVVAGLRSLYDPIAIISLQAVWCAVFWTTGCSWVTESTLRFRLKTGVESPLRMRPDQDAKSPDAATAVSARVLVLAGILATPMLAAPPARADDAKPVKNVIVLIADGCSAEQYSLARWFQGKPLALDEILVGAVKTYIADSVVADSAPAATAFATGIRSSDKFIGIGPKSGTLRPDLEPPEDLSYRPLATVLEGARLLGKATGVVVTSRVTHGTPAAYVAHVPSRTLEEDIMEQAVYQNVDVMMGGGKDYLLPAPAQTKLSKAERGKRTDGENLLDVLRARRYSLIEDRAGLETVKSGKVFGMFAMGAMAAEIDRPRTRPGEPTLPEMTRKAISLLSSDPDGFFLMVEGSQIDWAGHANDPAHLVGDLLMFDGAVKVALEFAKNDGNTLVLAFSDHNTGGLSIGNRGTQKSYSQMSIEELVGPLRKMNASAPEMWRRLCSPQEPEAVTPGQIAPPKVQEVVEQCWGVRLSLDEARHVLEVANQDPEKPYNAFGEVVCPKWTNLGFTTHGHTGGDVPLFAFGPQRPVGLIDGPEIGRITARALGLDLECLNRRLYVDVRQALPAARVSVEAGAPGNLVVRVALNEKTAELPVNKNLLILGDRTFELEGVVVYAPNTKKVYMPLQAVAMIAGGQVSLPSIAKRQ